MCRSTLRTTSYIISHCDTTKHVTSAVNRKRAEAIRRKNAIWLATAPVFVAVVVSDFTLTDRRYYYIYKHSRYTIFCIIIIYIMNICEPDKHLTTATTKKRNEPFGGWERETVHFPCLYFCVAGKTRLRNFCRTRLWKYIYNNKQ